MDKPNIGVVTGPWQAIILHASAGRAHFSGIYLLAPRTTPEFRSITLMLCEGLFACPCRDISTAFDQDNHGFSYAVLRLAIEQELPADDGGGQVWISSVLNWRESLFCRVAQATGITLYEDGMQSWFKFAVASGESKKSFSERIRQAYRRVHYLLRALSIKRHPSNAFRIGVDRVWVKQRITRRIGLDVAAGENPGAALADSVRHAINTIMQIRVPDDAFDRMQEHTASARPKALFMAQCFARIGMTTVDEECRRYARVIGILLAKGYDVIWKEHPRTGDGYYARVRELLMRPEGFHRFPGSSVVPIELALGSPVFRQVKLVGVISSSLVYSNMLYGYECYTAAQEFEDLLDPTHLKMARYFKERFKSYAKL